MRQYVEISIRHFCPCMKKVKENFNYALTISNYILKNCLLVKDCIVNSIYKLLFSSCRHSAPYFSHKC